MPAGVASVTAGIVCDFGRADSRGEAVGRSSHVISQGATMYIRRAKAVAVQDMSSTERAVWCTEADAASFSRRDSGGETGDKWWWAGCQAVTICKEVVQITAVRDALDIRRICISQSSKYLHPNLKVGYEALDRRSLGSDCAHDRRPRGIIHVCGVYWVSHSPTHEHGEGVLQSRLEVRHEINDRFHRDERWRNDNEGALRNGSCESTVQDDSSHANEPGGAMQFDLVCLSHRIDPGGEEMLHRPLSRLRCCHRSTTEGQIQISGGQRSCLKDFSCLLGCCKERPPECRKLHLFNKLSSKARISEVPAPPGGMGCSKHRVDGFQKVQHARALRNPRVDDLDETVEEYPTRGGA